MGIYLYLKKVVLAYLVGFCVIYWCIITLLKRRCLNAFKLIIAKTGKIIVGVHSVF